MMEIASAHGIIKKGGSWLTWGDCPSGPLKVQGTEKLRTHLLENEDDYLALRDVVMPLLGTGAADAYIDEIDDVLVESGDADLDAIFDGPKKSKVPDLDDEDNG